MNLQHIIQSEVSQKVKNKYVYSCIYMESRKKVLMNLLQASNGDADIENRLVATAGEGEGGIELRAVLKHIHYHM